MFKLPPELTPSELLHCTALPVCVYELLRASRRFRAEGQWLTAERCAFECIGASDAADRHLGQAAALVHLSDAHREGGALGQALDECRKAHRIFRRQWSQCQRHNEAMTAYALGLLHQMVGSKMKALKWYRVSNDMLERVKESWTANGDLARVDSCARVQRWMEALEWYLTADLTHSEIDLSSRIWLPIILREQRGAVVEQLAVDVSDDELKPHLRAFHVSPLAEKWEFASGPGIEYDAQEIPGDVRRILDAGERDNALVEWQKHLDRTSLEGEKELAQTDLGNFVRDKKGRVYVIRVGPRIIGGQDRSAESRVGYIPALLEPGSSSAAPPASESPDESETDPSGALKAAYSRLLRMVGGDHETAKRLIAYECRQKPRPSRLEAIERAVAHLSRDRH